MHKEWTVYRHGNTKIDMGDKAVPGPGVDYELYEVRISPPTKWQRLFGKRNPNIIFYDSTDPVDQVNSDANVSIFDYKSGNVFVHVPKDDIAQTAMTIASNHFTGRKVYRQ